MIKKKSSGLKERLLKLVSRWMVEDYPGSATRFEPTHFAKDIGVFILLPVFSILIFEALNQPEKPKKPSRNQAGNTASAIETSQNNSQIISFKKRVAGYGNGGVGRSSKKAPGTLVRIKLLNVVETYTTAPVHAQIVDGGLGNEYLGSTLLGDATPDSSFDRIGINFKFVKEFKRTNVALPLSARALSLNGTLGLEAEKKEGFFARATFNSTAPALQTNQAKVDGVNLNDILLKALASGFFQEMGSSGQVQSNRAQVLKLEPGFEFYAELTDFFPGTNR